MRPRKFTSASGAVPARIIWLLAGLLMLTIGVSGVGIASATAINEFETQPTDLQVASEQDATLSSLTLTADGAAVGLMPAFDPETTRYTAKVRAASVVLEATPNESAARIATTVAGDATATLTVDIPLAEGTITDFSLTVRAGDGVTTRTYTVRISRPSADTVPDITIEANRSEYVAGLGNLVFTLARDGDTASSLDVTVNLVQDQLWLATTTHTATFAAGDSEALLQIVATNFSPSVTQSGELTATVAPVSGYDTSDARARVRVISQQGPAVTVTLEHPAYTFDEDAGEVSVALVAHADPSVPFVSDFIVSFSSAGREATSGPDGDYSPISIIQRFASSDFQEEDGSLVARVEVPVTILDDDVPEGDEQFDLHLSHSPGLSHEVALLDVEEERCFAACPNPYVVTIQDNDTPTLRFDAPTYTVDEGRSQTIIVRLNPRVGRPVTIPIIRTNRGGASNSDYSGVPEELQFSADQTSRTFTFTTNQDIDVESGQSVRLSFGTLPAGVLRGTPEETIVSITDDDKNNADINVGALGVFWRQDLHPEADGNEMTLDSCAGTKNFRVIWTGPEGNRRADEWEARFTGDAASSVRYTFSESLDTQGEYFEMNATVGMTGETFLTMQVRGRFDSRWGEWSPKAGLYCFE